MSNLFTASGREVIITSALPATEDFKGLTAGFLGDSQTDIQTAGNNAWWSWVRDILQLSHIEVYGQQGTYLSGSTATGFYERAKLMDKTLDIIFVLGGVNDAINSVTTENFKNGIKRLGDYLKTEYTGKMIVFITPTLQDRFPQGSNVIPYANAIKEVCEASGIPVLDACADCGINPALDTTYTSDKLHYNAKGHELIGRYVANNMQRIGHIPVSAE